MNIDKELTLIVTHIIQIRDSGENYIICKKEIRNYQILEAAHLIKSSKSKLLKWVLFNLAMSHKTCNQSEENNSDLHMQFEVNLAERIGMEYVMFLNVNKNKTKHFYKSEKEDMLIELKQILSDLKKGDMSSYEKYMETKMSELYC